MPKRFELPYGFWRMVARLWLAWGFDFEVRGAEIPRAMQGPYILAGNHQGMLDTPMVMAAIRQPFRFLMAQQVFGWGWIGKMVGYANIIPLVPGREKSILLGLVGRLNHGERLCIFPEGKLTEDGNLGEFRDGVAFLQARTGVPIIPFAIDGGFEAWPIGQKHPGTRRRVIIRFGQPIVPAPGMHRREVTRRLRAEVSRMLDELRRERASDGLSVIPGRAAHAEIAV